MGVQKMWYSKSQGKKVLIIRIINSDFQTFIDLGESLGEILQKGFSLHVSFCLVSSIL